MKSKTDIAHLMYTQLVHKRGTIFKHRFVRQYLILFLKFPDSFDDMKDKLSEDDRFLV